MILGDCLALLVCPAQLSRTLEEFKGVLSLELLKTAWVKSRLRERILAQNHLLSLFWVIVILEHFVEHKVQQLLVRYEKLNKFLALDL